MPPEINVRSRTGRTPVRRDAIACWRKSNLWNKSGIWERRDRIFILLLDDAFGVTSTTYGYFTLGFFYICVLRSV